MKFTKIILIIYNSIYVFVETSLLRQFDYEYVYFDYEI